MTHIFYIFFLMIANIFTNIDGEECNLNGEKSPRLQITRNLFCDNDPSERPVENLRNRTTLNVMLFPKIVEFDDASNIMNLHTWFYITWTDEFLQWKEENVSIYILSVKTENIWTPDIFVQNAASADQIQMDLSNNDCVLWKWGEVFCVIRTVFSTKCDVDYTHWPFDRTNCRIDLSTWSYSNNEISFENNQIGIIMDYFIPSVEWNLTPTTHSHVNRSSVYMIHDEVATYSVNFSLERAPSRLWRVVGTPILILVAMTLTTLWLNPRSNERIIIACMNFFCHFLCIRNIHWIAPTSDIVPNILMFHHDSLILAVVALILTCLLRRIIDKKDLPPPWISSITSKIMSSKLGQILSVGILDQNLSSRLIQEDVEDSGNLVDSEILKKSPWIQVTTIVEWISFISFFFTYIILVIIYLCI